ncbi:MAG: orotidine 5'-phosphate decarboxylase / HUMPS family protein, partial [Nitrososphaera sp.]
MGVIALVYMSHPDAVEGYGLQAHGDMMYRIFLDRAVKAKVDGIVVGATQTDILSEISEKKKELKVSSLAVYSPGVGAQGGDARQAVESGSDYLIIGRSIVQAKDQAVAARWFRLLAASPSP